ncbi:MAG: histidinol-phosphatase [Clostridia bacterium]|nr:histidinol-phosphatase [Clostridia bacterium]
MKKTMNKTKKQFSNFHSHTTWCDGKNTVDEMVTEAIRLGCPQFGFSGHSPTGSGETYTIRRQNIKKYIADVNAAKEKYRDKIEIFCGIEQDFFTPEAPDAYEYVIGSVHSIEKNGKRYSVDHNAETQKLTSDEVFGGDFYEYAGAYFDTVIKQAAKGGFDILGHIDLVAKFNEKERFFDESDPRYKKKALEALESYSGKKVVVEINSGALSRGYREEFYPAAFLLERVSEMKMPVVFSSDCHSKAHILFGFEKMRELAKKYKLTVIEDMRDILKYTRG